MNIGIPYNPHWEQLIDIYDVSFMFLYKQNFNKYSYLSVGLLKEYSLHARKLIKTFITSSMNAMF